MQFYTKSYLSDTRRLSCLEHGLYCQLLFMMWENQGVLWFNEDDLAYETGLTREQFDTAWLNVKRYFQIKKDKLYNEHITKDLQSKKKISFERANAVKTRWSKNDNKNNKIGDTNVLQNDTNKEPEPEPNIKTKAKRILLSKFEDLDLKEIPVDWLEFAIGEGLSNSQAKRQFEMFGDVWRGKGEAKKDWLATWRNRIRNQIDKYGLKPEGNVSKSTNSLDEIKTALTRVDKGQAWRYEWFNMTEAQARQLIATPKLEAVR